MKHMVVTICLCLLPGLVSPKKQFLIRSSQGGDGQKPAGVWGGKLLPTDLGVGQDLFKHGFSRLDGLTENPGGIQVIGLSHDPVGHNILVVSEQSGVTSLATGSLCEDAVPSVLLHNVRMYDSDHPYLEDSECGNKCGWGPVAIYDGKIYFVLSAVFGKIYTQLKRQIQVRMLDTDGCADIIAELGPRSDTRTKDFSVLTCSSLVTTMLVEDYTKPNPRPSQWVAQHLAVGRHSGMLHFYTQLFDTTDGGSAMSLVHGEESAGSMDILYTTDVASVYTGTLNLRGLGSVDYRDGVLCWTSADTLLCSAHVPGGGVQPDVVVSSGEATDLGICTGNIPQESLKNTLTGVAIATVEDSLSVYFGCYAELSATGGVGLVSVSLHGLQKTMNAVRSGTRRVYGSHMIIMDKLGGKCYEEDVYSTPGAATSTASHSTTQSVLLSTIVSTLSTVSIWSPSGDLDKHSTVAPPLCVCETQVSGAQVSKGYRLHAGYLLIIGALFVMVLLL